MTDTWTDGFLAPAFREFYAFLSEVRAEVEADPWQYSRRAGESWEEKAAAPTLAVTRVRTQLRGFLQRQSVELGPRLGEEGNLRLDRAQYVMASLADEVFVILEWEGRELWAHDLLESHLFNSQVSGERIFERAEALLREGADGDRELAVTYLSALCLGFQGRYRGVSDLRPLQDLRRRLLASVTRGRPSLAAADSRVFPQALESTLVSAEPLRLPPLQRWSVILVAMVALYLFVGHLVWRDVSADLRGLSQMLDERATPEVER